MTKDEQRRVVAEFLGRDISDGEILTDVLLEALASLAVSVIILEGRARCEAHEITDRTEGMRAWLDARDLLPDGNVSTPDLGRRV